MITNHPARYRDPKTGLPYYNVKAYREIQRLHHGEFKWSNLTGSWVGTGTQAAKGVPERFLHLEREREKKAEEEKGPEGVPTTATGENADSGPASAPIPAASTPAPTAIPMPAPAVEETKPAVGEMKA